MFNAKSHKPIDWKVNDYAVYRGQKYYLNYVPSCVQRGRSGDVGDSFTYENVKMDDEQGKLVSCQILDVTPTTGDYVAAQGTNYTGSSVFSLYCSETVVTMVDYNGDTHSVQLSPVEYIGGVIQSNLNRLYPQDGWKVDVNPNLPSLDDKVVSFNKQYVTDALAMIKKEWDLNYIVIGRTIKIGYTLNNVTDDGNGHSLTFGYGRGYNEIGDDGKALFKIKRTSDSSQKLITRLRAMGSTRNMPYRYYNKKYELPQTMFVSNLQLPDTFEIPSVKASHNTSRDATYGIGDDGYPIVRHVLGDSNDAYIDKEDDAANCNEGIREGSAFWDGSDSELEEIYPTIKRGTYLELRGASIPDMDGTTGNSAYPNYGDNEYIDEILAIDEQTTNIGDGIMAEADVSGQQSQTFNVGTSQKTESVNSTSWSGAVVPLFTVNKEQSPGKYTMAASTYNAVFRIMTNKVRTSGILNVTALGYEINVWQTPTDGTEETHLGTYIRYAVSKSTDFIDIPLPDLPDVREDMKVAGETQISALELTKKSTVRVTIRPLLDGTSSESGEQVTWYITSVSEGVTPQYVWKPAAASDLFVNQPFYLYLKDVGIDMKHLVTTGEDAVIHFNTGQCGGMEFKFDPTSVEEATVGTKKGWKVRINERVRDDNLNVYYPNYYTTIQPGDQYVLLGIEFPEVYIKIAEIRLLVAATLYLADNCYTKQIYEPEVSDIYLQQNIDRCEANNQLSKSIYWNLYAGYKFSMKGIPSYDGETLPTISNITIKNVTIKEGDKATPQVEIVLTDDLDQNTIRKLASTVDRIYNSVYNISGSGGLNMALLDLTDVEVKGLAQGQALTWNNGKWVNSTIDIDAAKELVFVDAWLTTSSNAGDIVWDGSTLYKVRHELITQGGISYYATIKDAIELQTGIIYIDKSHNTPYRWDGEEMQPLSQDINVSASNGTITINDVTLNLVHNHDWSEIVNKPNMIEGVLVGNNKLSFKWSNGDIAEVDFSAIVNKLDKRVGRYGTASNRPGASEVSMGDMYIDTTLKRTLWVYGTPLGNVAWVDGEGYLYINNSTDGTPQT